jgi:Flp pilus assembly protein TadG
MVEFALTVVLLLVMLFGVIDFGRALYTYHFLSDAARDATRWAAVNGADCALDLSCNGTDGMNSGPANAAAVQNYVAGIVPPGIDPSKVTTTPIWPGNGTSTCPSGSNNDGCPVQVEVSYNFNFIMPLVHSGSITLSSTSELVISH